MSNIRWGIVGCGDVVRRRVAAAIQADPNSTLLAACRRNEDELAAFCKQFNVEQSYTNAADLIDNHDIDAVYIATPVSDHVTQTLLAARAEKHVLVEKPMAISVEECDQMIDECDRRNVTLGVAYYRRFYPVVERIRAAIAGGEIGTPLACSVVTATPLDMQPGSDGYWRADPQKSGGGSLMDVGSHRVDLLVDLFGKVRSVKAHCSSIDTSYKAENVAGATIQFQSGVLANLMCLFGTPVDPDEFTIIGTKGRITSRPLNGGQLEIQMATETKNESHPPAANFNTPLIADFVAAIAEKRKPKISGEAGRLANDVLERAYINAGGSGFMDSEW